MECLDILDRARLFLASGAFEPSAKGLATLTAREGIDFATAALYEFIRRQPRHAALIRAAEGDEIPQVTGMPPRIVVMPGAYHVEFPRTGADGGRIFDVAGRLGWECAMVPVPSLAPMARNAAMLIGFLLRQVREHPRQPIVLVSLSKGGADVRRAMGDPRTEEAFRAVAAWVSISGMVYGSPLVAWLRARPIRCMGVRLMLRLRGQRFADVDELRHDPPTASFPLPPHIRAIHILGFPLREHLSDDWARRGHERLAPLGPSDGGGILLADALRLPGEVYPLWGADHYMRRADTDEMLRRVLLATRSRHCPGS